MTVLSQALRDHTAAAHRRVEHTPYVRAMLAGRLDRRAYGLLLRSLHEIYAALEGPLAQRPEVAALRDPALARRAALEDDLLVLHGPHWREELAARPAALAYARHLAELAGSRPLLLAAHAYVRYLGDLNGGQLLQRSVARGLALHDGEGGGRGTRFYHFDAPAWLLAQRLRGALDGLLLDAPLRQAIVDEAGAAFERHAHLFEELEAARVRPDAGVNRPTGP
jgi:heme oxygenase